MNWPAILLLVHTLGHPAPPPDSPFIIYAHKAERFRHLPVGDIRPEGWLRAQMLANLRGFTGHLDSLAPGLLIRDDIFGRDRLTRNVKRKDVGALAGGDTSAQIQYLWWNSETQGNWRDGFIRSAILTGDPQTLSEARAYVRRILSTQDPNGYLGIYDRDLRYRFHTENGELWAKTTLLRGLLAWYEYTREPAVLTAVERAVADVMRNYPAGHSHPFYSTTPYVGGLSHGLMFTDVLGELYRLTGRKAYLGYIVFLYRDFSAQRLNEDAQYSHAIDPDYRLQGHGVHTYEHLRALAAAAWASGNPRLQKAWKDYLGKIEGELSPSGGPAGDEWIAKRSGDATTTGYEYCSLEELMDSYIDLMQKTGSASFGDDVERLFFNAAQGARDPEASCIAYLKTDNSYQMTGGLNGDTAARQIRYKYSPVHQDAAVCCVPNAGRIAPYFVDAMWMLAPTGPVATLLGPCVVSTTWKGQPLKIRESTGYPDDFTFDFTVAVARPVVFTLIIRKPAWATRFRLNAPYTEKDGYIRVTKTWKSGESIRLAFLPAVQTAKDRKGDTYFTYGPLVLAHPIPATSMRTKRYPLAGFYDYQYRPDSLVLYRYDGGDISRSGEPYSGFGAVRFEAMLSERGTNRKESVWLVPMGGTILRQVTFQADHAR
ncbi:MAG TPA: beta-L-arabinofuranosidase domain-containing protein [Puia sp.]|nr:beta-L-arabinofuranosidase domain-containing protein [Puia sp.]